MNCTVAGKVVELCLTPNENRVTYRFGPAEAPEIELTRDFDAITMQPWSGIGRGIWDMVEIPNGDFIYELHWNADKIDRTVVGGVNVRRGEAVLASVSCDAGGYFDFDTLIFAMQDAGFCRSDTVDPLSKGSCE
ncbi:hypothetical protein [Celeribacter sp.]|uniref:hypothetical protein n=1 Tax=Celeribacter sp. TaxID=1890673 RepID=UPI003A94BB31